MPIREKSLFSKKICESRNLNLNFYLLFRNECVKLPSQPQMIAVGDLGFVVVACLNEVSIIFIYCTLL